MSTFLEYVLPHFTLEELAHIRAAMLLYRERLVLLKNEGTIEVKGLLKVEQMCREINAEYERRITALEVGGG